MRWTVGSMYMVQDSSDQSLIPVFIIWRMRVQANSDIIQIDRENTDQWKTLKIYKIMRDFTIYSVA